MCASAKVLRAAQHALMMDKPPIGSAHSINGFGPYGHAPMDGDLSHTNGTSSSPPLLLLQEGQFEDEEDATRAQGQEEERERQHREDRKEEQGKTPLVYSLHEREKGEEGKETDLIAMDGLEANVYKGSGEEGITNTSSITPVGRGEVELGDGGYRVGADLKTQDASGGTESDSHTSYPFPFTPGSHEEDKSKHHHKSKKEQREGEGKEAWWASLFSVTVLLVSVTVIVGKIMEVFRLIIWV